MKKCLTIFLVLFSISAKANDTYRAYLFSKISFPHQSHFQAELSIPFSSKTTCAIPRYEIPKGNVFCRLEDKLTRATKIWIKVGVK